MYVSHLKLNNWRNFKAVEVDLRRRTILVGPNASGKSNFLDVFRFLRHIAKPGGGLQDAIAERGGLSAVRCLLARKHPNVEIDVSLREHGSESDCWRYAVSLRQQPRGDRKPYLEYEKVWHNGIVVLDRPDADDKKDELRLTQTFLEQINANVSFREIAKFFQSVTYLHLIPQLVRHPRGFFGPALQDDPFGKSFLERIGQVPEKIRVARLKQVETALKIAVPQLKELKYLIDAEEGGIPHLEAVYEHWRPNAGRQRESEFSDGTLRLLALVWSLLESDSLLLLEEPELSLHGAIVKRLAPIIHRTQTKKNRQVLLSTHSGDLLDDKGIDPSEILVLDSSGEGTTVTNADRIKNVRTLLEEGFSPAEAILPRTAPANVSQLSLF